MKTKILKQMSVFLVLMILALNLSFGQEKNVPPPKVRCLKI